MGKRAAHHESSKGPLFALLIGSFTLGGIAAHKFLAQGTKPISTRPEISSVESLIAEDERQRFLEHTFTDLGFSERIGSVVYDPDKRKFREDLRARQKEVLVAYVHKVSNALGVQVETGSYQAEEIEKAINNPHNPAVTVYDPSLYATGQKATMYFFKDTFRAYPDLSMEKNKAVIRSIVIHEATHASDFHSGLAVGGHAMGNQASLVLGALGIFSDMREAHAYAVQLDDLVRTAGIIPESFLDRYAHHLSETRMNHRFVPECKSAKAMQQLIDAFIADHEIQPLYQEYVLKHKVK